jgi:hypothetical protein
MLVAKPSVRIEGKIRLDQKATGSYHPHTTYTLSALKLDGFNRSSLKPP